MKIIVPCCGTSSRFDNVPPEWMLPSHDGRSMLEVGLYGLEPNPEDLLIAVLREHERQFDLSGGLERAFGRPVKTVVLDAPPRGEAHTVAEVLRATGLDEPFLVKSPDKHFELGELERDMDYVCVDSLNRVDSATLRDKAYLQVDAQGYVTNIREKTVIADTFGAGGTYFTRPEVFLQYWDRLDRSDASWNREIFLSDLVAAMILDGIPFQARSVSGYQEFGTVQAWREALLRRGAYFVAVDGFLFERGSENFAPSYEQALPRPRAVEAVEALHAAGHTIVYLSTRPRSHQDVTARQLGKAGLPPGQLVMDCPVTQWTLVTSPDPGLPFLTGRAVELSEDDPHLLQKLAPSRS